MDNQCHQIYAIWWSKIFFALLRRELGNTLLVVVPGIRPVDNQDDQKRTVSAEQALRDGADYLVVGRPIRDANDPKAAAEQIQEEIYQTVTS